MPPHTCWQGSRQPDGPFKVYLMSNILSICSYLAAEQCQTRIAQLAPVPVSHTPLSGRASCSSPLTPTPGQPGHSAKCRTVFRKFPSTTAHRGWNDSRALSTFSQEPSQWEDESGCLWPMRHYQDSLCPDPVGKRRKKKKCESFFGKLRVKREREDRTRVCDRELRGRSRVRAGPECGSAAHSWNAVKIDSRDNYYY